MANVHEIQVNLLKILKEFHELCIRNDIKYSLYGGTLIGAIREKGFLSWDDDADIMMERKEFNKLIKILSSDFKIVTTESWVPRLVYKNAAKLEGGRFVDIFIFDNAPDNTVKHKLKVLKLRVLQGTLKRHISWSKYSLKGKILAVIPYILGKLMSKRQKLSAYERIAQDDKKTTYVCAYKDQYRYMSNRFKREVVRDYIKVPFEDLTLLSMAGYHEYLSKVYGDYMTPPPEEERRPDHGHAEL